jgi:hypothetical protein
MKLAHGYSGFAQDTLVMTAWAEVKESHIDSGLE